MPTTVESVYSYVVERSVSEPHAHPETGFELTLRLKAPLPPAVVRAVTKEWQWCAKHPTKNALMPRRFELTEQGQVVHFSFNHFDIGAIRLDRIQQAFRAAKVPVGPVLSAWLVGGCSAALQPIHKQERADGGLSLRHMMVGKTGGLAIIAPTAPLLRRLMIPEEPPHIRHYRLAPETLTEGKVTPASDVYSLAAIYYELLSSELYTQLPGALPDPRDSLLQFLAACLNDNPGRRPQTAGQFLAELLAELKMHGLRLDDRSVVSQLIQEYTANTDIHRGPKSLFSEDSPPLLIDQPLSQAISPTLKSEETSMVTIVDALPKGLQNTTSSPSAWAEVLGEEPTPEPQPEERLAHSKPRPKLSMPLPDAPTPASARPSILKDSQEHILTKAPSLGDLSQSPSINPSAPSTQVPRPKALPQSAPINSLTSPTRPPPTLDDAVRLPPKTILAIIALPAMVIGAIFLIASQRTRPSNSPSRSLLPSRSASATVSSPSSTQQKTTNTTKPHSKSQNPANRSNSSSPGLVSVISLPSGATVLIDGEYAGITPLVLSHKLSSRRQYAVEVNKDNYESWSKTVRAKDGSISLVVHLVAKQKR